jgi:pimeloyl-ACP methyl ester carboxylesterase
MRHISLFIFLALSPVLALKAQRSALFLNGIGATSKSWGNFIKNASSPKGLYSMDAMEPGSPGQGFNPGLDPVATSAGNMNAMLVANNKTNVLGIGHDGGGIVLRKMANDPNTRLTGIILDGVPNKGSNALRRMLPSNQAPLSEVENLIADLERLRASTSNCTLCDVLGSFKSLTSGVKSLATRYEEYTPGHSTITGLGLPPIPYAVIWGNADTDVFALDRMLSSNGDGATGIYDDQLFIECIKKKLDAKDASIKTKEVEAAFNAITGLFKGVSSILSSVKIGADGKISVDQGKLYDGLSKYIETTGKLIKDIKGINAEAKELLECELVRQVLNAKWNLIVGGGYTAYQYTTTNPDCCWSCYGEPPGDPQDKCFADCFAGNKPKCNQTVTIFQSQPHDGLYSKDEQLLDGAAFTYEAEGINHFQEQAWFKVGGHFRALFDGQNLAFKVPK